MPAPSSMPFLLAALVTVAAPAVAQGPLLPLPQIGIAGDDRVAIVDFDGDGHLDLVTASELGYQVRVQRGDGAGGFALSATVNDVATAADLEVGDWNGDGRLDVATVSWNQSYLALMLGDGAGGLSAPAKYFAGIGEPRDLATGRFDTDPHVDFAVMNRALGTITVYAGSASGALTLVGSFSTAGGSPQSLAAGDFDQDGLTDLAVLNAGNATLALFRCLGNGLFAPPVVAPSGAATSFLRAVDMNGDGRLDLVQTGSFLQLPATSPQGAVRVLLGAGNGSFAEVYAATLPVPLGYIATADTNGDGAIDLLVASRHRVKALLGLGNGQLASGPRYVAGHVVRDLAVGDLNEDGSLDLVAESGGRALSFLPGDHRGGFRAPTEIVAGARPWIPVAADLDGDGWIDLAVSNLDGGNVSIERNAGDGVLALHGAHAVGALPYSLVAGDLDGDGDTDLAAAVLGAGAIATLRNDGGAGFSPGAGIALANAYRVSLGDVDGDGLLDAAVSHLGLANDFVTIAFGDGGSGFASPIVLATASFTKESDLADLDGDGAVDLVVANDGGIGSALEVRRNVGGGAFGPPAFYFAGFSSDTVEVGDLDGDGDRDLVVSRSDTASPSLQVLLGAGDGTFGAAVKIPSSQRAASIAIADLDGDGLVDLVASTTVPSTDVVSYRGTGGGAFTPPSAFGAGNGPNGVAVADFDRDGAPDVAVACAGSGLVTILAQRGCAQAFGEYGTGTPGCAGTQRLCLDGVPRVGNAAFALRCSNAPASALGLGLAADGIDALGSDPFGLGLLLHVSLFASVDLVAFDFTSDANGLGAAPLPIPANPLLAGRVFAAQAIWAWPAACLELPLYPLSSSEGHAFTILP